jgi:hypothetical protein
LSAVVAAEAVLPIKEVMAQTALLLAAVPVAEMVEEAEELGLVVGVVVA